MPLLPLPPLQCWYPLVSMLDQDENNFAWGEGGLECADLNVTYYRVFHSECLNSFCNRLQWQNLPSVTRRYLRSYTKRDAQKVENNYRWTQYRDHVIALQDMWTELERWFGNTAAITNVLIERLRKTARFQEGESDKLQSFVDVCVDMDSQLDFLPGLTCFNYLTAVAPIVQSLPLSIRSKWEKCVLHYAERYRDAYPGFCWARASPVKKTTASFSQARNQTTRSSRK